MNLIRGVKAAREAFSSRGLLAFGEAEVGVVTEIVEQVRMGGDCAVRQFTKAFDGVDVEELEVSADVIARGAERIDPELKVAILEAAERIQEYYQHQPREGFWSHQSGGTLGQIIRPLSNVGIYVPGGSAPLFSSLLMLAIPAKVAGVRDLVVATPPGPDGAIPDPILYTINYLGITRLFRMGGAQAIAALAYGTESVPRVDKVVGPGNRFVVLAKRAVFGDVGIEALPGPTETLILADEHANPIHVTADLLAQAEHLGAHPLLVTNSEELIDTVQARLLSAVNDLPTADNVRSSLQERGAMVLVADLNEGIEVVNLYAPEHLCLLTSDPWDLLDRVQNAGGVFMGAHSPEVVGDYNAGPSHVMPTSATARFASFVNLRDFQKVIPVVELGPSLVRKLGPSAALMARAEGLEAHARAIEVRLSDEAAG
jgi:histidinol dehydrogenase